MNHYNMGDLYPGMMETFQIEVTEDMMKQFCQITGDVNPLHQSKEFANEKGFEKEVCYGFLTASFLSTLAGVYLPGERSLIREVNFKLPKPVFVGDILTIAGEVTDKNEAFGIFDMKVSITNQKNEKVLRGKLQMGILQ